MEPEYDCPRIDNMLLGLVRTLTRNCRHVSVASAPRLRRVPDAIEPPAECLCSIVDPAKNPDASPG